MTVLKDYPYWPAEKPEDVQTQLRDITNIRKDDITQFANLPNIFLNARKVGKIPADEADVDPTDKINDMNWDSAWFYVLVEITPGNVRWRRTGLAGF